MPWFVFLLLAANVLVGGYLLTAREPADEPADVRALEVNPDKVKVVGAAPKGTGAAGSSEGVQGRAPEQAAAAPSAPSPAPQTRAAGACIEWGPLTQAELERAQDELAGLDGARTIVRELALAPAWWVHVPPLASRADAERRAREIEAAGVQDVHVVTDGERWRNAISLGIFKTEEAANAQLARMRAAQVRNVALVQRNDLLRTASILIFEPPAALAARIAQLRTGYPGSELRAVACPA